MPQVLVIADVNEAERATVFRERVNPVDFETDHSARQLVQRLEWAVDDASLLERHARERDWRPVDDPGYAWEAPLGEPSDRVLTTAS